MAAAIPYFPDLCRLVAGGQNRVFGVPMFDMKGFAKHLKSFPPARGLVPTHAYPFHAFRAGKHRGQIPRELFIGFAKSPSLPNLFSMSAAGIAGTKA
jgi:hypothetical protein